MKKILPIALTTLALASCGKDSGKETVIKEMTQIQDSKKSPNRIEKEEVIFEVKRAVEMNEDLSNYSDFIQSLNSYNVKASVKNPKTREATLVCTNTANITWTEEYKTDLIDGKSGLVNIKLSRGAKNLTTFNCLVRDEFKQIISEAKIELNKDYIVFGIVSAKELGLIEGINKIGALVIHNESTLTTEGMNLSIKATDFIARENAQIESYKKNELSSEDNSLGKSGGIINISAERSLGKLKVHMRGKNGGRSTNVDKSYNDFSANSITTCPAWTGSVTMKTGGGTIIGLDGFGGGGGTVPVNYYHIQHSKVAYEFPNSAAKGPQGGDSGSFFLHTNSSSMEVIIHKESGRGGKGGQSFNPQSAITVEFYKAANFPNWSKKTKPQDKIGNYGTTDYIAKCDALVKIEKPSLLVAPILGQDGDMGRELVSCINVKDTNDNHCI